VLLYQAYGSPERLQQCVVSIYSLQQLAGKNFSRYEILIYTEHPEYFKKFFRGFTNLSTVPITNGIIAEWKGSLQYSSRFKIKMLEDFFRNHDRRVLYVDADNYFISLPDTIFSKMQEDTFVTYNKMGNLLNPVDADLRKMASALKRGQHSISNKPTELSPKQDIWHTAAIGLHPKHKVVLGDVLSLSDQLYEQVPLPAMESMAFSYVMNPRTETVFCNDVLQHYNILREGLMPAISACFAAQPNAEGAKAAFEVVLNPPKQVKRKKKGGFWSRLLGG
jgi:hypothetical protein